MIARKIPFSRFMYRKHATHSCLLSGLLAVLLCAVPGLPGEAHAQQAGKSGKAQNRQVISGGVIDIIGSVEWPRGDTHIPWRDPEGIFKGGSGPEVDYVHYLRREISLPMDRESLRRRTDLERSAR